MKWMVWLWTAVLLTGCLGQADGPAATAAVTTGQEPAVTSTAAPTVTVTAAAATAVPATRTPQPTAAAQPTAVPTAVPSPTPTPHPLFPFTLEGLRSRASAGGEIGIRSTLEQNDAYTRYYVNYPSDGLTVSGIMHLPSGSPPFPVLILLHGYIERDQYFAGADTWQAADFFARHGYLVLAPDLRSWGESDSGLSLFHMGLTADVINLISALPSLAEADVDKAGLWGHSMGGGIATKVLAIDERVAAAVLYAPNSADDADLIARWGAGCLAGQKETAESPCNPAEVIPAETPPELVDAYFAAAADPIFLRQVAPLYHLEAIAAPVQIHIGTADGQSLTETPVEWSAKLAEALQANDHAVEYFVYEGQGHLFTGQSWTTLMERALAFYDGQLQGAP